MLSEHDHDRLAALAEAFGRGRMSPSDRSRFDDLVTEAEIAWTSHKGRAALRKARAEVASIGPTANRLARALTRLIHDDTLRNEFAAADASANRLWSTRALYDLHEQLTHIARVHQQLSQIGGLEGPNRGRPETAQRVCMFVYWLGQAWRIGTGHEPKANWSHKQGRVTGPFVDFVAAALGAVDPGAPRRMALGDTIKRCLQQHARPGVEKKRRNNSDKPTAN